MANRPALSVGVPAGIEVLSILEGALGEHYNVRLEEETVHVGDDSFQEPVVRIYTKGGVDAVLSLWLSN